MSVRATSIKTAMVTVRTDGALPTIQTNGLLMIQPREIWLFRTIHIDQIRNILQWCSTISRTTQSLTLFHHLCVIVTEMSRIHWTWWENSSLQRILWTQSKSLLRMHWARYRLQHSPNASEKRNVKTYVLNELQQRQPPRAKAFSTRNTNDRKLLSITKTGRPTSAMCWPISQEKWWGTQHSTKTTKRNVKRLIS